MNEDSLEEILPMFSCSYYRSLRLDPLLGFAAALVIFRVFGPAVVGTRMLALNKIFIKLALFENFKLFLFLEPYPFGNRI